MKTKNPHQDNFLTSQNKSEYYRYMLLVVLVTAIAFFVDIASSNLTVELGTKSILNKNGDVIKTTEISYPLWHQLLGLLKNFLYGLAAAIFITVFVANRMQKTQNDKRQAELDALNNAININIFDALFKTIIPADIFRIIKQDVIENKVIRKEAKWILDFRVQEDGKILCRQTTRYELHNVSQKLVSDPIKLELSPLGGSEYKVLLAECLSKSGEKLVHYDETKLNEMKNVEIAKKGDQLIVSYTVEVPAESYVEYKTIFERTFLGDVVDAMATKVPVINAEIIANFPAEYDFDITALMSTKPRLITSDRTQKIYRIAGGILPYQSFIFFLVRPKIDPNDLHH